MKKDIKDIIPPEFQPTAEEWRQADEALDVVIMVNGYSQEGVPFWAYLAVPPSRMAEIKTVGISPGAPLLSYGRVLEMGLGEGPAEEVKKRMEEEFGLNHNLEQDIISLAREIEQKEKVKEKYSGKKVKKKSEKPEENT